MTSSQEPAGAGSPLLLFARVSKRFGGTLAVQDVTLDLEAGDILARLGENSAGKSTTIKMLAGIHHVVTADNIELDGRPTNVFETEKGYRDEYRKIWGR